MTLEELKRFCLENPSRASTRLHPKRYPERFEILKQNTKFLDAEYADVTTNQRILHVLTNHLDVFVCEHCKIRPCVYNTNTAKYRRTCSDTCTHALSVTKHSFENFKEKCEKTMVAKHGFRHSSMIPHNKKRLMDSINHGKMGIAMKKGVVDKFGVDNYFKTLCGQTSIKSIISKKYGVDSYLKTKTFTDNLSSYNKLACVAIDMKVLKSLLKSKPKNYIVLGSSRSNHRKQSGKITILHETCGEISVLYKNNYLNRIKKGVEPCRVCNPFSKRYSAGEKEVLEFIKNNYAGTIIDNDRKLIKPREIDILLSDLKIAIEYNGTNFHADPRFYVSTDKVCQFNKMASYFWDRDATKVNLLLTKGFKYFPIWEYDWKQPTRRLVVQRQILRLLNR